MADNLTIKDGNAVARVMRTTDSGGVHTPQTIVQASALPTGASTAAKQDAIVAALGAISTALALLGTSAKQDDLLGAVGDVETALGSLATSAKQDSALVASTAIKTSTDLAAPASGVIEVSPSDDTNLATAARSLYVGEGGDVSVIVGGTTVTFANVPSGAILPIRASRVRATGTTASLIVALL